MSLRSALLGVALVVVALVLLAGFLGMGPVGWVVVGTMLVIGAIQVHRTRRRRGPETDSSPQFCVHCGAALDVEFADADRAGDDEFEVNYCGSCGAPVPSDADAPPTNARTNCPDCGARNDADRSACSYCEATL